MSGIGSAGWSGSTFRAKTPYGNLVNHLRDLLIVEEPRFLRPSLICCRRFVILFASSADMGHFECAAIDLYWLISSPIALGSQNRHRKIFDLRFLRRTNYG
jgi:hypothetical protein